jgi:Prohead core protein protease.
MLYATSNSRSKCDYAKFPNFFFEDFIKLLAYPTLEEALANRIGDYMFIANDDMSYHDIKIIDEEITQLNESTISDKFMYVESPQIPLIKIEWGTIKHNVINPVTKKPYKGIVLEGIFADFNNLNNNNRLYDIPQYLILLGELRKKIHSERGVYGELEHPKSYAVDYNNASHKILDVWYDENTKQVKGYVLLLNTPKGKIAQEIVETGGCLAISARAAGEEIDQPNGTKLGRVKLLTTYDLVYHPGFDSAVMKFKELNESEHAIHHIGSMKNGYSLIIANNEIKSLNESYNEYLKDDSVRPIVSVGPSKCFFEWYQGRRQFMSSLSESQQNDEDIKEDQEKMQDAEIPLQDELEDNLEDAVQEDLLESDRYFQRMKENSYNILKNIIT